MPYFQGSPEEWDLIQKVQRAKREEIADRGKGGIHNIQSDRYVLRNPVTGEKVPIADLKYALKNLNKIYSSGAIRETRWAFLWYN